MPHTFSKAKIMARLYKAARTSVREVFVAYQVKMKLTLSRPGGGRLYRIGKGKRSGRNLRARGFHRASAPGQPPAANTGTLRRSWQISIGGGPSRYSVVDYSGLGNRLNPRIRLGSSVRYARMLQYGTTRMRARPYVNVAARSLRDSDSIGRIVRRNIREALKR